MLTTRPAKKPRRKPQEPAAAPPVVKTRKDFDRVLRGLLVVPSEAKPKRPLGRATKPS